MIHSQILDIFERNLPASRVGSWMFNFCQRRNGSKLRQRFVESHDYRHRVTNPYKEEGKGDKTHYFIVECEHGWMGKKCVPDLILDYSKSPDTVIALELEHALTSIRNQCDLCRLK